jgi:hypothetical protein
MPTMVITAIGCRDMACSLALAAFRVLIDIWCAIRAAERSKSIKVTEFGRRQLSAVRKELDREYEAQIDLNRRPSKVAAHTKISTSLRLDPKA